MKKIQKVLAIICLVSMLVSVFSIAATAKIDDKEEDSRLVLLAGKFYKVYESNEVTGDNDYLMSQVDYVALKMSSITGALGGYAVNDAAVEKEVDSTDSYDNTDNKDDTDSTDNSDSSDDTEECENGVCYVDTVLDEDVEEKTLVKLDADEAVALFEANTSSDATSVDNTEYPYSIKSALDDAGVDSEIWTVSTKEGRKIYLNVFELEDGKQVKAFTYNGKPREVTTLSEGSDIMAKRLLCKVCNIKKSFGKVVSISE